MTDASTVRDHYQAAITDQAGLLRHIAAAVDAMAAPVTAAKLARMDQFHMGGLAATAALAGRVAPAAAMRVLDAGSGLGGPARYLAETFGCTVEGIDLSPAYVEIAALLTGRVGLAGTVAFRQGTLLELPFKDGTFDLVWTQHVAMNISDRARLYAELRRMLHPGGRLAFYDPILGDGREGPHYPVPWAVTPATSTLLTEAETLAALQHAGFRVASFDDVTVDALGWASRQPTPASPEPTTAMIVGARMGEMAGNFVRSLKEGRVRLAMGVCEAA